MAVVLHKSGSEGPKHDPYHYDEWTVMMNGQRFKLHDGLAVWAEHNDTKYLMSHGLTDIEIHQLFESWIGCLLRHLERAWHRSRHICKKCGCRETHEVSGYVGETINVCVKCGNIVSDDFHPSMIE